MKQQKLRMPAEWEPQSGVLLSWPTNGTDWRENLSEAIPVYLKLVKTITQTSHAYICCIDSSTCEDVKKDLKQAGVDPNSFTLSAIPYDDTWTRDYGPVSVYDNNNILWLNFKFNAWGEKYPYQQDNQLTNTLHQQLNKNSTLKNIDFILEGGSIESDGAGSLLTTSKCLLHPSRNTGITKKMIENFLLPLFGLERILWLDNGNLSGDDTDAHIDTLARFCSVDTIAYVQCTDKADPDFESLRLMEEQLQTFSQINGQPYHLIPLPHTADCFNQTGQRLPASYANFLILNGSVLAPVYGVDTDSEALSQLKLTFPTYTIIPIQCRALIEQFGSLHCITMQFL